jgi:hypothetical protein
VRSTWSAFLAALSATVVLSVGVGLIVSRAAAGEPAPVLRTESASALAAVGITLAAEDQPPYCGATQYAAAQGWFDSAGQAGCAISRSEAIDAAQRAEPGMALEAVLARVSANGAVPGTVGTSRVAWVVVVRASPFFLPGTGCGAPTSVSASCASGLRHQVANHVLVIIDATTGLPRAALLMPGS